jgi:uncharacterized protein YlaI
MRNPNATLRKAERNAFCRSCDKVIEKGEDMVSMYSWRNRGQHIHLCLDCSEVIGKLAKEKQNVI